MHGQKACNLDCLLHAFHRVGAFHSPAKNIVQILYHSLSDEMVVGGLGLAATQVAFASGCVPLGTAGSSQKRSHLRSLGVPIALSSRSIEFPDQLAATGQPAPDMVFNSLTSPGKMSAPAATSNQAA